MFFPAPFPRKSAIYLEFNDPFEIILASDKMVVEAFEIGKTQDTELIKLKDNTNNYME